MCVIYLSLQNRRVAPPELPPATFYTPLRQLLAAVKGGARFRATTLEDILAAVKPPFTLQEAAAPAAALGAPRAPAAPRTLRSLPSVLALCANAVTLG